MKAKEAVPLVISGGVARGEYEEEWWEVKWNEEGRFFLTRCWADDSWKVNAYAWSWRPDLDIWKILSEEPQLVRLVVDREDKAQFVKLPHGSKPFVGNLGDYTDNLAGYVYQLPDGREVELQKAPPVWCLQKGDSWFLPIGEAIPTEDKCQLAKLTHILWLQEEK